MQARILSRVARMKNGQFGDCKAIDRNLYELRLFFGTGYRVYFGEQDGKTVLILAGGDKSTQSKNIKKPRNTGKSIWRTTHESIEEKQYHPT
jgi:putative addiction module killer protein